jgi:Spy/CpxP family protein refolding chaperone
MVFTIVLFAAVIAAAQPMDPGRMAEKLGLTDQQVEQMRALQVKHQTDMIMRRAELKIARLELREIMMNAKLNENSALSKQDQISKMKSDIARVNLQHKIAMRKILTDEQQKKWQEMRHEMRPGPGRHHGRGGRGFRGDGPMGPCDRMPMSGPGPDNSPHWMDKDGGEKGE